MDNFKEAINLLFKLEFNSPRNFLHKNSTERGFTVGGIYRYAHEHWSGWRAVDSVVRRMDIESASEYLYADEIFVSQVKRFYKNEYWYKLKLNEVESQIICNEIFLFAVNVGKRTAVRKAQKIVGVTVDGLIGPNTIKALNNFNENKFDFKFDDLELQYYADLIKNKPSLAIYKNGWNNRANYV